MLLGYGPASRIPISGKDAVGTFGSGYPSYLDSSNPNPSNFATHPSPGVISNVQPNGNIQSGRIAATQPPVIGSSSFLNKPIANKPTSSSQGNGFNQNAQNKPSILSGRKATSSNLDGKFQVKY